VPAEWLPATSSGRESVVYWSLTCAAGEAAGAALSHTACDDSLEVMVVLIAFDDSPDLDGSQGFGGLDHIALGGHEPTWLKGCFDPVAG
jgi:hypothetical protein